jgi:hypothetical protein
LAQDRQQFGNPKLGSTRKENLETKKNAWQYFMATKSGQAMGKNQLANLMSNILSDTADTPKMGRSECPVSEVLHQSWRATFDIGQ